ncbi:MAG: DNA methylase [Phycisphaerales bacterium]
MAVSPAHRWGQIIGEIMESAVVPLLEQFAETRHLYLDKQGSRPSRTGRKCTWVDAYGNAHDLDFVLERNGSPEKIGSPVAFIETAWRRYTKHSRNKAQEIQGAILPLADTYRYAAPFKGAILAGEFTDGALTQMRSLGFTILYFPYELIVDVFGQFGIDASSAEDTPDKEFKKKAKQYERLSKRQKQQLPAALIHANDSQVKQFLGALTVSISRRIQSIVVLPLHGHSEELPTLDQAIAFLTGYDDHDGPKPIQRYEIQIRYSNGDSIEGRFADKQEAIRFLKSYDAG